MAAKLVGGQVITDVHGGCAAVNRKRRTYEKTTVFTGCHSCLRMRHLAFCGRLAACAAVLTAHPDRPADVRSALATGTVVRGMTRDEVAIGYQRKARQPINSIG